jgi:hypothetical protein
MPSVQINNQSVPEHGIQKQQICHTDEDEKTLEEHKSQQETVTPKERKTTAYSHKNRPIHRNPGSPDCLREGEFVTHEIVVWHEIGILPPLRINSCLGDIGKKVSRSYGNNREKNEVEKDKVKNDSPFLYICFKQYLVANDIEQEEEQEDCYKGNINIWIRQHQVFIVEFTTERIDTIERQVYH